MDDMGTGNGLLVLEAIAMELPAIFENLHEIFMSPFQSNEQKIGRIRAVLREELSRNDTPQSPARIVLPLDEIEDGDSLSLLRRRRRRDYIDIDEDGDSRGRSRSRTDGSEIFDLTGACDSNDLNFMIFMAKISMFYSDPLPRPVPATFHCLICLSDTQIDASYQLDCSHRICATCLSGHITSRINSGEVDEERLTCPFPRCTAQIALDTVRECCSADTFRKLTEFRLDRFVDAGTLTGSLRRCPGGSCDYAFEADAGVRVPFSCPKCLNRFCLACAANAGSDGPGHPGRTCAERRAELDREADERRRHEEWRAANARGDAELRGLASREGWRACPRCLHLIERNGGCDHMTCSRCRCSFCYVCGKWDRGNPEARGDCGTQCRNRGAART